MEESLGNNILDIANYLLEWFLCTVVANNSTQVQFFRHFVSDLKHPHLTCIQMHYSAS